MRRPVDNAMAAERPEKQTIRELWVQEAKRLEAEWSPGDAPLYLTLPGERGGDIHAMAENGIIELAENGAIADAEQLKLVAVEGAPGAVVKLQTAFPGLKILEQPLGNLLHSTNPTTWPTREIKQVFRARVVNLDLNAPLEAKVQNQQIVFPVLELVQKVVVLHADEPRDWTLCLTLHGEIVWTAQTEKMACLFLQSNFQRDEQFSEQARAALGDDLHATICGSPSKVGVRTMDADAQQRVLMVLVPKQIAFDAHTRGWSIDTVENLRYGGSGGRAPMVTWVLRFRWDARARTQPEELYREALGRALARRGHIDTDGVLRHA